MSSGFITESEALEARKKRQEEWERVRKADDPLERPEEPYDHRSLYEKLQEQKQKKDLEYEEAHKLKNMIKGLDDDEIEFLDLVDRTKLAADRKKTLEEEQELNDYRNRVATLQERSLDKKLQVEVNRRPKLSSVKRTSQVKLLKGAVIKRPENRKHKLSDMEENKNEKMVVKQDNEIHPATKTTDAKKFVENESKENKLNSGDVQDSEKINKINVFSNNLQCIGILPGMGCYDDSSSDASSDSDRDDSPPPKIMVDMLGRKVIRKEKDS